MKSAYLLPVLFGLFHSPTPVAARMEFTEVKAHVRKALDMERFDRSSSPIQLAATGQRSGVDVRYDLTVTKDGRFVEKLTGRLGGMVGYDGRQAWQVDRTGMPDVLFGEDRDEALQRLWGLTGYWASARSPLVGAVESENDETIGVRLSLRGSTGSAVVLIDRRRWMPLSITRDSHGSLSSWQVENYQMSEYGTFPGKVTFREHKSVEVLTFAIAESSPRSARIDFRMPTTVPHDVKFDSIRPAETEVRRAPTGHLLVHPLVNGKDIGWFIFDSGAGIMVIDPKAADIAGIPSFGRVYAVGVGGVVEASYRQGRSFELGPVTLENTVYMGLDLSMLKPIFGVEIAGICGYDLFRRVTVAVDIKAPRLALYNPNDAYEPGAGWEAMELHGYVPTVMARFEGNRQERFRLDTGANDSVTFHAPTVVRHKLLENRKTEVAQSGGVGGESKSRSGRIEYFELGGLRFNQPLVSFSEAKDGVFASESLAGNIGSVFLEPFRVVFDYAHRRIAFVDIRKPR